MLFVRLNTETQNPAAYHHINEFRGSVLISHDASDTLCQDGPRKIGHQFNNLRFVKLSRCCLLTAASESGLKIPVLAY